jgi:SAM-dependent methyltransferase
LTLLAETAASKMCGQCGGDAPLFINARDYNKKISDKTFSYYKCTECSFIFLDPIPADLGRYYPAEYYEVPKSEAELLASAERWQRWKLETVKQFKAGGKLLEIGPAYGLFAFLAKREGFDVTGIEMDQRCCEFLRGTVGIDVVENADTVVALKALPEFDVIVMWQVFEHLPDPWAVLEAAAERLAPGGVIIMDMPNPDSFQFKVLGHRWAHLDAPRHVTLIPADLLVEKGKASGLRPALLTASDKGANGFNGFGWAYTFKNYFGDGLVGRLALYFGRALGKLLIPIERTGWRGSTYTAVLRKEPAA